MYSFCFSVMGKGPIISIAAWEICLDLALVYAVHTQCSFDTIFNIGWHYRPIKPFAYRVLSLPKCPATSLLCSWYIRSFLREFGTINSNLWLFCDILNHWRYKIPPFTTRMSLKFITDKFQNWIYNRDLNYLPCVVKSIIAFKEGSTSLGFETRSSYHWSNQLVVTPFCFWPEFVERITCTLTLVHSQFLGYIYVWAFWTERLRLHVKNLCDVVYQNHTCLAQISIWLSYLRVLKNYEAILRTNDPF